MTGTWNMPRQTWEHPTTGPVRAIGWSGEVVFTPTLLWILRPRFLRLSAQLCRPCWPFSCSVRCIVGSSGSFNLEEVL